MYFGCAALAAWWQQNYCFAIFLTAISALLGWPFAALIGIPLVLEMLLRQRDWKTFVQWTLISGATVAIPMIAIDTSYFGKLTFAPLNIVWYNVFTSHGPNIFGTEPLSYYIINGFLNFNIIWVSYCIYYTLKFMITFSLIAPGTSTTHNAGHRLFDCASQIKVDVKFPPLHLAGSPVPVASRLFCPTAQGRALSVSHISFNLALRSHHCGCVSAHILPYEIGGLQN